VTKERVCRLRKTQRPVLTISAEPDVATLEVAECKKKSEAKGGGGRGRTMKRNFEGAKRTLTKPN